MDLNKMYFEQNYKVFTVWRPFGSYKLKGVEDNKRIEEYIKDKNIKPRVIDFSQELIPLNFLRNTKAFSRKLLELKFNDCRLQAQDVFIIASN